MYEDEGRLDLGLGLVSRTWEGANVWLLPAFTWDLSGSFSGALAPETPLQTS